MKGTNKTPGEEVPTLDTLLQYENGLLDWNEQMALLQALVNTGMAWKLQGFYGRAAQHALNNNYITPPQGR